MSKKVIKLAVAILSIILHSCASDTVEDYYDTVDCATANVSFSETIQPIINANCAVSGCHVTGTGLPSWESYDNISNNAVNIARRTALGEMPPVGSGKSLTSEEVELIQCWVNSGAENN